MSKTRIADSNRKSGGRGLRNSIRARSSRSISRSRRTGRQGPIRTRHCRGLSLFEVLIALAVFVGSIAAIGQLISTGVRGAVQARLQSQAVLRAETQMAEVVAGLISLHGASGVFPDDPMWSWSVMSTASSHANLYTVEVTVAHSAATAAGRQSYSLRRLVRDPQMALDAYALAQEAAAAAAASGSSSTTNSSGTGGGASSTTSGGGK